jgi:hypothetical protein
LGIEKLEGKLKTSKAIEEEASRSFSTTNDEITKIIEQLIELQHKKTDLESPLKAHDEEFFKRKVITSGI